MASECTTHAGDDIQFQHRCRHYPTHHLQPPQSPTRKTHTPHGPYLLDLALTANPAITQHIVLPQTVGHCITLATIHCTPVFTTPASHTIWKHNHINWNHINDKFKCALERQVNLRMGSFNPDEIDK